MVELPQVSDGFRVIPLWRNVSGTNFSLIYEIVGYTIVDEIDFGRLNNYRWFMWENSRAGDCYAYRVEHQGGKKTNIYMAREILNLPRGAGCGGDEADHEDHNTLNNRRGNLRVATSSQNKANRRGYSSSQRFKGVRPHRNKYYAQVGINGLRIWFTHVMIDIEAALMHNYATYLLHGEYAELNVIPEDEMPNYDRQWELYNMVVTKLRLKGFSCKNALIQDNDI